MHKASMTKYGGARKCMPQVVALAEYRSVRFSAGLSFDKHEIAILVRLYTPRVSRGEWRDYAIGIADRTAWFSVCRCAGEPPVYTVTKTYVLGVVAYTLFEGKKPVRRAGCLCDLLAWFNPMAG